MVHRNMIRLTVLGLALCGAASSTPAHAGTWSQRTVAGMTVQIYAPDTRGTYPGGRGLMIGLHGCTQQATALKDRGHWEPAADRFGVVIALPQVPNGGVVAGCWDYYGANHTRSTRHEGPVLALVDALLADGALGVDRAQVYVSGLSSGAGEAMVLGCVAPDVFAGVGINAGPAVGTEISEIARVASTAAEAAAVCRRLAGAQAASFDTQLTSVAYGTQDFVVAQGYGRVDAEAMASLYGAATERPLDVTALPGFMPRGTGATWSDARGVRAQMITIEGMGHAFPAGSGDGFEMSFIASRGVAWPMVMIELFTSGNRRAGTPVAPTSDAGTTTARDSGAPVGTDGGARPAPVDAGARRDGGGASLDAGSGEAEDAEPAGNGGMGGSTSGGCATTGAPDPWLILVLGLARATRSWRARALGRRRNPAHL